MALRLKAMHAPRHSARTSSTNRFVLLVRARECEAGLSFGIFTPISESRIENGTAITRTRMADHGTLSATPHELGRTLADAVWQDGKHALAAHEFGPSNLDAEGYRELTREERSALIHAYAERCSSQGYAQSP